MGIKLLHVAYPFAHPKRALRPRGLFAACSRLRLRAKRGCMLYSRYPIVARALPRPSARASKGIFVRLCLPLASQMGHTLSVKGILHTIKRDATCIKDQAEILYTRYPIVARRAWPAGRVRRASKGMRYLAYKLKSNCNYYVSKMAQPPPLLHQTTRKQFFIIIYCCVPMHRIDFSIYIFININFTLKI